ncbi:transcriptional regulator, TetR family [Kytococcus aerolatus]|uniref:Transcriptional regulator, TetR family n=1 Tax=Kytococcus aerolatus TaxID=592308 RepID=A0A212U5U7_9MICO|nr:TetR/AcrR family transcriptional regulator [Kytococcus aerolatus]SNC73454.1 transcriptional regulator, TetR family [Kytococcus aerolatus]
MGRRDEAREQTRARILEAARCQVAEQGASALSTRAVAREVGVVSSAIFRHFPTRDALLTALIMRGYRDLAETLAETSGTWEDLAHALRHWTLTNPHDFQLLYGTPVADYAAPPETVPAALDVARPFLRAGGATAVPGFSGTLEDQLAPLAQDEGLDPSGAAAVLSELATLIGLLTVELAGHLRGTADPAGPLFAATVARQLQTLGLPDE